MRVSCSEMFKQKRKEGLRKLLAEVLEGRMLLAWEFVRDNEGHVLCCLSIDGSSLDEVKVVSKKLDISKVRIVEEIRDCTGEQLISTTCRDTVR